MRPLLDLPHPAMVPRLQCREATLLLQALQEVTRPLVALLQVRRPATMAITAVAGMPHALLDRPLLIADSLQIHATTLWTSTS